MNNNKMECSICAEILIPDAREGVNVANRLRPHLRSPEHERAERETLDRMAVILQRQRACSFLSSRIELLLDEVWRNEIKAILYEYLGVAPSLGDSQERKNLQLRDRYLQVAEAKLFKYENMQRLSLLELAVWKSTCLLLIEKPLVDYFEVLEWSNEKWKDRKGRCRCDKSIHVVVSNVARFL